MRAALLTKHKSVALVNNFADPSKTSQELELSGAINLKSLVEQKHQVEEEDQMNFTKNHSADDFIQGIDKMISSLMNVNSFIFKYVKQV